MIHNTLRMITIVAVLAGGMSAPAEILVSSDFEADSTGWITGGLDNLARAQVDDGYGVSLADTTASSSLWSYNTTNLPLLLTLDLDYRITNVTADNPFVIGLHVWGNNSDPMAPISGPLMDHKGYFLTFTGGADQKVQLIRRKGPNPEDTAVAAEVPWINDDGLIHHLRITDCGCGNFNIFIDNMAGSLMYVPDKYNYVGGIGSYLGVGTPGDAAGWIDNVVIEGERVNVPEPATLALMLLSAGTVVARRRR